MNYIVLDLEWNQSSTGREPEVRYLPFEIVEIGAVKLNEDKQMVSEFSELIRPQVYHQMHRITSKLIHLQMEELQSGDLFQTVYKRFHEWCGEDVIYCSWGPLDLTELQRNIEFYGLRPIGDGPIPFLDIQKIFSIAYEDRKSRRSLEWAVDFLEIEKDIPFHRAFSDAYYTAKVLAKIDPAMLIYQSYDCYHLPKTSEDEVHVVFGTDYAKYISRIFADKSEAMQSKEVSTTKCFLCNKALKKKIKWFSPNGGKHYFCISECDEHGYMKSKARIKKTDNSLVYVVKTDRFVTAEEAESFREKQEQVKQQKKERRQAEARRRRERKRAAAEKGGK